jgi:hypothetical protein
MLYFTKPSAQEAVMRQSTKYLLLAGVTLVTVGIIMTSMSDAYAIQDFGTLAKTKLKDQTGGAANLLKQLMVVFGVAFILGGVVKLYNNAKNNFKDGAKDAIIPILMVFIGGLSIYGVYGALVGMKSIGGGTDNAITNTTGGEITW